MSEEEVRALRAQVYCGDCTDENWQAVRRYWMGDEGLAWLKERAKRPLKDYSK